MEYSHLTRGQRDTAGCAKTVVVGISVFTPAPKHPVRWFLLVIAAGSSAAFALQFTKMVLNVL